MYLKYKLLPNNHTYDSFKGKKKIIITLAADYQNIGDIAITIAQKMWLEDNFPGYEVIDFPISETVNSLKALKSVVEKDDIITTIGGGNITELYWDIELCRQLIIKEFPNNKIISFPQSVFLNDEKKFKKTVAVYSKHKDLTLVAREKITYDIFKNNFKENKVLLTPDIVLYLKCERLKYWNKPLKREGISVIIRKDSEALIQKDETNSFINYFKESDAKIYDTIISPEGLKDRDGRDRALCTFLEKVASSEVVVTNRLHAMILSTVTQTPCIVLPINNHKIIGVLEWLNDLNYIKYVDSYDLDTINPLIEEFKKITVNKCDLDDKFKVIRDL